MQMMYLLFASRGQCVEKVASGLVDLILFGQELSGLNISYAEVTRKQRAGYLGDRCFEQTSDILIFQCLSSFLFVETDRLK